MNKSILCGIALVGALASAPAPAQTKAEAKDMALVGYSDLQGRSAYQPTIHKQDGRWMIARTSYRRVFEELQPRGNVEGLSLTASWWATDGRSKLPAG